MYQNFKSKSIMEFELELEGKHICFFSEIVSIKDKTIQIKAEHVDLLNIPVNTPINFKSEKDSNLWAIESKLSNINKVASVLDLDIVKSNKIEREAYRIEDLFSVYFRVIPGEEYELIKDKYSGPIDLSSGYEFLSRKILTSGGTENQEIYDLLIELHKKMDILIKEHISKKDKEKLKILSPTYLNLSAVGMGFYSPDEFNSGNILEIVIDLPTTLPVNIHALGKVTKSFKFIGKETGLYKTGLEFVRINHHDQESLIQYIMAKQRELLRMIKDKEMA